MCVCVVQLLWEREREEQGLTRKQSFVDLGCGNGLLVYLLTSEGVSISTVEPPNNGHIRDECFVHCSEVVPSLEVEM